MKQFFNLFFLISIICANTAFAEDHPTEYTSPERLRSDLDRLEKYVHKKLGLNDLEHPTGTPVEKIEVDNNKPDSIYDKGKLSHLHAKLDDQNDLVADLLDRIERLEHQDNISKKGSEKKNEEIQNLKEHISSLQEQLDLTTLEVEKLRGSIKHAQPETSTEDSIKNESPKTEDKTKEQPLEEKAEELPVLATAADYEIDLDGKSADEVFSMAEKHLAAADYNKAKFIFNFYINMDITDAKKAKAHYYLGEIYKLSDQSGKASEHYLQAFQADPTSTEAPESLIKLGICLHDGGKTKAGCSALKKAKSEYPKMTGASKSLLDAKLKEFKCPAN